MLTNISIADYHASDAISHSKLEVFEQSPLLFYQTYVTKTVVKEGADSAALTFGQAFHLIMEGELAFAEGVATTDKWKTLQGSAAQAWVAEQKAAGKIGILESDVPVLRKMAAMVKRHQVVQELIAGGQQEVTFRKSFPQYAIQCRADIWSSERNLMVDWKTVRSIDDFEKNVVNYGYHKQAEFYRQVISICLEYPEDKPRPRMIFVACEKEPPYEVQPFELDEDSLSVARGEIIMSLRRLNHCFETGNWDRPQEIRKISLPFWYARQAETRLLEQGQRLELEAAKR